MATNKLVKTLLAIASAGFMMAATPALACSKADEASGKCKLGNQAALEDYGYRECMIVLQNPDFKKDLGLHSFGGNSAKLCGCVKTGWLQELDDDERVEADSLVKLTDKDSKEDLADLFEDGFEDSMDSCANKIGIDRKYAVGDLDKWRADWKKDFLEDCKEDGKEGGLCSCMAEKFLAEKLNDYRVNSLIALEKKNSKAAEKKLDGMMKAMKGFEKACSYK